MSVARQALRRLNPKTTALFLCDMQEKFRPNIQHFDEIVATSARLLRAAKTLDMAVVATEQYPKGLGPTVAELGLAEHGVPVFEKTCFSMVSESVLAASGGASTVALCGIEAHACVYQTTLELLEKGVGVQVVADAVSSRSPVERKFALRQMELAGAWLTTSECLLLSLLGDASHPNFRQIQKLIMQPAPHAGLLDL